jgi:hypothetical protein
MVVVVLEVVVVAVVVVVVAGHADAAPSDHFPSEWHTTVPDDEEDDNRYPSSHCTNRTAPAARPCPNA